MAQGNLGPCYNWHQNSPNRDFATVNDITMQAPACKTNGSFQITNAGSWLIRCLPNSVRSTAKPRNSSGPYSCCWVHFYNTYTYGCVYSTNINNSTMGRTMGRHHYYFASIFYFTSSMELSLISPFYRQVQQFWICVCIFMYLVCYPPYQNLNLGRLCYSYAFACWRWD